MLERIPRNFINDLLMRTDIVDVISKYLPLRRAGSNFVACCPFHQEKSPSFTVSQTKQFYHCFGCSANGNAISFLMEYDHMEFVEAVEMLAQMAGQEVPHEKIPAQSKTHRQGAAISASYENGTAHKGSNDSQTTSLSDPEATGKISTQLSYKTNHQAGYALLEKAASFYQKELRRSPAAIDYLKARGLSGAIAKEFGIGYAPSQWDSILKYLGTSAESRTQLVSYGLLIRKEDGSFYDRFRDRIMFPIRDRRGRIIAFGGRILGNGTPKYLNSPETPLFHKGKELYGLYEARRSARQLSNIIIVEGYMDLVMLAQYGIRNVVATLGTATTPEHIQLLMRSSSEIIFCFDGDNAGKAAAWRALQTSLPLHADEVQIGFIFLPHGEDPDSFIKKEGTPAFANLVAQAMPLSDFFFSELGDQFNLSSIDGKSRFSKAASELLKLLPPSPFRTAMFDRLSSIVRIKREELEQFAGLKNNRSGNKFDQRNHQSHEKNKDRNSHNSGINSDIHIAKTTMKSRTGNESGNIYHSRTATIIKPLKLAIALLLQYPALAKTVQFDVELQGLNLSGSTFLSQLIDLLTKSPDLTTGALLENWRDHPNSHLIHELATWQHNVPEQSVAQALAETIKRLKQLSIEKKIEALLTQANQKGLSPEEKMTLQSLISTSRL